MTLFESPRLRFREFKISDAESMYLLNKDLEVIKYTGDAAFGSVEVAKTFLKNYDHYCRHTFGRWAAILKDNGTFIGWCGLKRNEADQIDLGFRFFREHWNKGYASEAALASLKYGFENFDFDTIIGRAAPENKASIRVLEKIGMKYYKKGDCHGFDEALYYKIEREDYIEL